MEILFQGSGDDVRRWKSRGTSTLTLSSDADSKTGRKSGNNLGNQVKISGFRLKKSTEQSKRQASSVSADQKEKSWRKGWHGRGCEDHKAKQKSVSRGTQQSQI